MKKGTLVRKSNEIGFVAVVLAILALPFIVNESDGTVAPSIEQLLSGSHMVVLATVSGVENPGAAKRTITLKVKKVLWPNFRLGLIDSITLPYEKFGKGDIDFERIKK